MREYSNLLEVIKYKECSLHVFTETLAAATHEVVPVPLLF